MRLQLGYLELLGLDPAGSAEDLPESSRRYPDGLPRFGRSPQGCAAANLTSSPSRPTRTKLIHCPPQLPVPGFCQPSHLALPLLHTEERPAPHRLFRRPHEASEFRPPCHYLPALSLIDLFLE